MFKHSLCFGGKLTTSFISRFYIQNYISLTKSLTKLISSNYDEAYLADLSDKIDKSNICILFELLTNADIADI